ncbi:MAG: glycoside hydrolase family 78 protein [Prevotella sp.]|nr:alpha-L-rhamnosidase [Prevotella sp.]MCI2088879.1 glycoside hydrolase family 78 protein [Prevotella sp.]
MRHKYFLILLLLVIAGSFPVTVMGKSKIVITDLLVNYEAHPYGVEGKPVFSWKIDAGENYKVMQKGYRIQVGESIGDLHNGIYVYDSGNVTSGLSVSIPYEGQPLQPCTRYFWKVTVRDRKGRCFESRPVWFETSLMNSGWDGAQWIGADHPQLSEYASDFIIDFDVMMKGENNRASFLFAFEDSLNYARLDLDASDLNKPVMVLSHRENGIDHTDSVISLKNVITRLGLHGRHHIRLILKAGDFSCYRTWIALDGKSLNASDGDDKAFPISFSRARIRCRLYAIGFNQPQNADAAFSRITIRDRIRKTLLYSDPGDRNIKGDSRYITWLPGANTSAPMVRRSFSVGRQVKSARLYATARGIYEMYVNGHRVSDDFLNPGWTDYRHRFMYNTFDVTELLNQGRNSIGSILGEGWYSGFMGYSTDWQNQYGDSLSLMAKLVINYADGSRQVIVTDGRWKCTDQGPVRSDGLYTGEDYDARKEMPGWSTPDFDDSSWYEAKTYPALSPKIMIQPYIGNSVRVDTVCTARSMSEPLPHTYIYDMGQNMVGIPCLCLHGTVGQTVTVRYGEMKYPGIIPVKPVPPYTIKEYEAMQGQLYTDNLRGALASDHYTFRGDSAETVEPHFTCHGFRYIEITGLDYCPPPSDIKVLVLNSLPRRKECSYETSDSLINRLYKNIIWGERGNFVSVPTDCPQRDERLGWMGDAQIFSRTSTYNRMTDPFFRRWFYAVRDGQGDNGNYSDFSPIVGDPRNDYAKGEGSFGWTEAGIIIPWQLYQQYGDRYFLEGQYPSMQRYMQYAEKRAKDYIEPVGGYGDWVAILGTQSDLTNTCYFAYDAQLMSKIAGILGKSADSLRYHQLFGHIKEAFHQRYVDSEGYMLSPVGSPLFTDSYSAAFGTGPKTKIQRRLFTETAYIMPLEMNLLDGEARRKALAHLVNIIEGNHYCLNTGFIGTPYLNLVLSENGCDSIAYRLFQQTAYPSWLYPVLQGATTIWERWNSYTIRNGFGPVGMNSFNHYSYGAVQEWMMEYSAGIQRDDAHPAYKHFYLQPRVGGRFNYIHASYESMYGRISSSWDSSNQNSDIDDASRYGYTYRAVVPANTTATLRLEVPGHAKLKIIKGKKGIIARQKNTGDFQFELGSGKYQFKVILPAGAAAQGH